MSCRVRVESICAADLSRLDFIIGRLTQLIALTGPAGAWRKTLIDKSIACVDLYFCAYNSRHNTFTHSVGRPKQVHALRVIRTCTTTSENFYIKVRGL